MRTLAAKLLPSASKDVLDQIPLVGLRPFGRAEKFYLGELIIHRGKTVDQVIEESVVASLEYSNFNDTSDVAQLLKNIGIDLKGIKHLLPDIDQLMQRRHQIVHKADRDEAIGSDAKRLSQININDINKWLGAVLDLFTTVMAEIGIKEAHSTISK